MINTISCPRMLCSALRLTHAAAVLNLTCLLACLAVLPRYLVDGHEPSWLEASARVVLASSPRSITYKARLFLVLFGMLGILDSAPPAAMVLVLVCGTQYATHGDWLLMCLR